MVALPPPCLPQQHQPCCPSRPSLYDEAQVNARRPQGVQMTTFSGTARHEIHRRKQSNRRMRVRADNPRRRVTRSIAAPRRDGVTLRQTTRRRSFFALTRHPPIACLCRIAAPSTAHHRPWSRGRSAWSLNDCPSRSWSPFRGGTIRRLGGWKSPPNRSGFRDKAEMTDPEQVERGTAPTAKGESPASTRQYGSGQTEGERRSCRFLAERPCRTTRLQRSATRRIDMRSSDPPKAPQGANDHRLHAGFSSVAERNGALAIW